MSQRKLKNTEQVVEALGGIENLCELTGANKKRAWNWVGRRNGRFPANLYVLMNRSLQRRGCTAPATLWSMKGLKRAA